MKDLALVVADKNMDFTLRGILNRPESLGIRPLDYEIRAHAEHDGGVRTTGPELLALFRGSFQHGLLMLDHEGSGAEDSGPNELERNLDARLEPIWKDRAKAIVIDPEVDVWIWGSDNKLAEVLEWNERDRIRDWLQARGFVINQNGKPLRPKEALEAVMTKMGEPRSSRLYENVTSNISLKGCVDPAFLRLKGVLQGWFPKH